MQVRSYANTDASSAVTDLSGVITLGEIDVDDGDAETGDF